MSQLPDFLQQFHTLTGINPTGWRAWRTRSMISVCGISRSEDALALRDFFIRQLGMAADLNEPPTGQDHWGVVAVPLSDQQ